MISRIIIGYDGSDCADAAIDDLRQAGLPDKAEALVLSAADVWLPSEIGPTRDDRLMEQMPGIRAARDIARRAMDEATRLAEAGAARIRAAYPGWTVAAESCGDSPYWALIQRAESWKADLLVVGSHGRSAVGRWIMGSVSQKAVHNATCSVRIGRRHEQHAAGAPLRILLGVDGSAEAGKAVQAVAERNWPAGTEVAVLAVSDLRMATAIGTELTPYGLLPDVSTPNASDWARRAVDHAARELRDAGLKHVSSTVREGDPKRALVDEAREWGADCLFVGAKGMSRLERFMIGSVSATVAAHAPCTVEVVR